MILTRVGRSHRKGLHSGRETARLSYFARGSDFHISADETYIGGIRKNMHASRRREMRERYGGGGVPGKTAVAGAKDRDTGRIHARVVPDTRQATLQGFVADVAAPGATVYTDEARAYLGMPFNHEAVGHNTGEFVRGMAHTNGMESFWSMLVVKLALLTPRNSARSMVYRADRRRTRAPINTYVFPRVLDRCHSLRGHKCGHGAEEFLSNVLLSTSYRLFRFSSRRPTSPPSCRR